MATPTQHAAVAMLHLGTQWQQAVEQAEILTVQLQKMFAENKELKAENDKLKKQLAAALTDQPEPEAVSPPSEITRH